MRIVNYLRHRAVCALMFIGSLSGACNHYHRNQAHPEVSVSSIEKGEALAARYCQSCHALPDPESLDTKNWEKGVLPNMGPHLGIFSHLNRSYPSNRNDRYLDRNYYPSAPMMKPDEWQNIVDYYTATSPD